MDVAQRGVGACLPSHYTFQLQHLQHALYLASWGILTKCHNDKTPRKVLYVFLTQLLFFFRFAIKPACKTRSRAN